MSEEQEIIIDGRRLYLYPLKRIIFTAGQPATPTEYEVTTYSYSSDKKAFNISNNKRHHLKEDCYSFRITQTFCNNKLKWKPSLHTKRWGKSSITLAPANTIIQALRNGLSATRHLTYY